MIVFPLDDGLDAGDLHVLATEGDYEDRLRIAEHPNVTVDILKVLAFDENASVRRSLLEYEELPFKLFNVLACDESSYVRSGVARCSNTPIEILKTLAKDKEEDVRLAVATRADVTPEVLMAVVKDRCESVRNAVAENINSTPEILEILSEEDVPGIIHVSISKNPNASGHNLYEVVEKLGVDDLVNVAAHKNTPLSILRRLKGYPEDVVAALAGNLSTPIDILSELACHPSELVREAAGGNNHTPIESLETLLKDPSAHVRSSVLSNKNIPKLLKEGAGKSRKKAIVNVFYRPDSAPEGDYQLLASDEDSSVRRWVARCEYAPQKILAFLAKDEFPSIGIAVAENQNSSMSVIWELAEYWFGLNEENYGWEDGECDVYDVQEAINENLYKRDLSELDINKAIKKEWHSLLKSVAQNDKINQKELKKIFESKGLAPLVPDYPCSFSLNSNMPSEIIEKIYEKTMEAIKPLCLSDFSNDKILGEIARHKNTPLCIIESLKADYLSEAAKNPGCSIASLIEFSGDDSASVRCGVAQNSSTPVDVLVTLASDSNHEVRVGVARNPNTPVDTLIVLASDSDDEVRSCVARNLNTPADILVMLASDSNCKVVAGVAGNLNTPVGTLISLASDCNEFKSEADYELLGNPNCTDDVFLMLIGKNGVSFDFEIFNSQCISKNIRNILFKKYAPQAIVKIIEEIGDNYSKFLGPL